MNANCTAMVRASAALASLAIDIDSGSIDTRAAVYALQDIANAVSACDSALRQQRDAEQRARQGIPT